MKTKLIKKFDKRHPRIQQLTQLTHNKKIDYLKRIKYVVNNGGGYAREAESARARRTHLHD